MVVEHRSTGFHDPGSETAKHLPDCPSLFNFTPLKVSSSKRAVLPNMQIMRRLGALPRPVRTVIVGRLGKEASAMRLRSLSLEMLEDRAVPATFTVTSLADSGQGSLRDAINQ